MGRVRVRHMGIGRVGRAHGDVSHGAVAWDVVWRVMG